MKPLLLAVAIFGIARAEDTANFPSPDKGAAVVRRLDENKWDCYAITNYSGRTLALCPDDARLFAIPIKVLWSADSQLVSIETHTTRHGSVPDIWLVSESTAHSINVAFPTEKGDFHFNPVRWLNNTDLELSVTGIDKAAPDRENPVKTYRFTLRVDLKARTAKVIHKTKPAYGHF